MARYCESVCRLCRREREKLFLKGDRCYTDKCAIERREYPPGAHGQRRKKTTEYATQLREKQKIKRIYGVMEKQFRRYFHIADRKKGITGEILISLLEGRLDNVAYRMGFATSRSESRQLISHGHFLVNGKVVNIPSYQTKPGDVVHVRDKSKKVSGIVSSLEAVDRRGIPYWFALDKDKFSATIKQKPSRLDISTPMNEQLVVELYSK